MDEIHRLNHQVEKKFCINNGENFFLDIVIGGRSCGKGQSGLIFHACCGCNNKELGLFGPLRDRFGISYRLVTTILFLSFELLSCARQTSLDVEVDERAAEVSADQRHTASRPSVKKRVRITHKLS